MKYIAKNIAAGFKNNCFLIILIIAIQAVSVWIFLFSFGMFNSYIDPHSVMGFAQKEFKIEFLRSGPDGKYDKSKCITVGEFRSRLDELKEIMGSDFYYIILSCISDYETKNGGWIPLRGIFMTQEAFQLCSDDGYLVNSSLNNSIDNLTGEWGTVAAGSEYKDIIGDEFIAGGKSFAVEYGASTAYVNIAFQSLPEEALIYEMEMGLPYIPNREKSSETVSKISEFFGIPESSMVEPPFMDDLLGEQEKQSNIILYALISILIHVNLQLIFIHLIHKRRKGQESFILAGCSALKFRLIVFGEVFFFLAAGTAVGWFGFNGLLLGFIKKTIEDFPILYESVLFKYGCLSYIGVALAFSVLNVIFNIKGQEKFTGMRHMEGGD